MNHLPYRAIALDLDGTLTNHDKVVTPKPAKRCSRQKPRVLLSSLLQADRPTALNRWQNVWNWINEADTSYLIMAATS